MNESQIGGVVAISPLVRQRVGVFFGRFECPVRHMLSVGRTICCCEGGLGKELGCWGVRVGEGLAPR